MSSYRVDSIMRRGYGGYGAVFEVEVCIDKSMVSVHYKSPVDMILTTVAMFPVANFVVEMLNNARRLNAALNKFITKFDVFFESDKTATEVFKVEVASIVKIQVSQKTAFHAWLMKLMLFFPLLDLFVISLGASNVNIYYKNGNKIRSKKLILPTGYSAQIFLSYIKKVALDVEVIQSKTSWVRDIVYVPINLSMSLLMLAMFGDYAHTLIVSPEVELGDKRLLATFSVLFFLPLFVKTYALAKHSYLVFKDRYYKGT